MKKKQFVFTKNVIEFVGVAGKLQRVEAGVPGMALVHGDRGFGKTSAAIYYTGQKEHRAIYLRAKQKWNYSWMMEELCIELGVTPRFGNKAKHDDVVGALLERPRLLAVDEANLMSPSCLETLRGINDMTHNPVVFIGHEGIVDKLRRMGPLFDRLLYICEFKPLAIEDLRAYAAEALEIPADLDVLERVIKNTGGNFRKSVVALKSLEDKALADKASKIGAAHITLVRKQDERAN